MDPVIFLEISLTENWLIFITRANGPFWSSIPSWQLTGAILVVDIIATCFTIWGWFVGGQTSIVAVVRIWIFSFGVFCIMGGVYYILQGSTGFDNLMHGKSPKGNQKQRSLEDFGKSSPSASDHVAIYYDEPTTNALSLQLSLSSACLRSTRSRNKCDAPSWEHGEDDFYETVVYHWSKQPTFFSMFKFVSMLLREGEIKRVSYPTSVFLDKETNPKA